MIEFYKVSCSNNCWPFDIYIVNLGYRLFASAIVAEPAHECYVCKGETIIGRELTWAFAQQHLPSIYAKQAALDMFGWLHQPVVQLGTNATLGT